MTGTVCSTDHTQSYDYAANPVGLLTVNEFDVYTFVRSVERNKAFDAHTAHLKQRIHADETIDSIIFRTAHTICVERGFTITTETLMAVGYSFIAHVAEMLILTEPDGEQ